MLQPNQICYRCMSKLPFPNAPCPHCGARMSELSNQPTQLPVGSILAGKYLVGCTLGQGGFGITYIGWELNLNRKLAIKEYYPEGFVSRDNTNQSTVLPLPGDRGAFFQNGRAKFVDEARVLARFSSDPGIVSVHDFFNENGTAYIVMDFVDGKTLKRLAAEQGGKLPAQEVLQYILPVMDSLMRVHAAGLLHRDISPDNIIIRSSDDRAVLLDFGAARQMSAMGEHSNTINVKHGFAPEEQYRTRGEQGSWTDIYALCATIYRLTTGKNLLSANDRIGPEGDALTPITCFDVDLTGAQKAAITKGLSVWGKDRQQSIAELKRGLEEQPERAPKSDTVPQDVQSGIKTDNTKQSIVTDQKRRWKRTLSVVADAGVVVVAGILVFARPKPLVTASPISASSPITTTTPLPTGTPITTVTPYTLTFEEFEKQFTYADVGTDGVMITGYLGMGANQEIAVPMYVEDKMVVAVGENAFFDNDEIKTVKLPSSVTSIGEYAFGWCDSLTSVEMPSAISIGEYAFEWCDSLTSVEMHSVTSIGEYAFWFCDSLTSVEMHSVTDVGGGCFSWLHVAYLGRDAKRDQYWR